MPGIVEQPSTIPVIDLSDFETRKEEVSQQLLHAARDVGFFYVSGHGIPDAEVDKVFEEGLRFFALDDDVKQKYIWVPDRYLGWRGHKELSVVTGNKQWEWASFGRYGAGGYDVPNKKFLGSRWPEQLGPNWAHMCLDFQAKTHKVALMVLEALALALHMDVRPFLEARALALHMDVQHKPFLKLYDIDDEQNPSFMAWNHYPPIEASDVKPPPRLFPHADMDCISLLWQRNGDKGLEIAPGKDVEENEELNVVGNAYNAVPKAKKWIPVDPRPGCITVNIGDGLAWWTDGLLKSTYHRVRAPRGDDPQGSRMSMPYFVNPRLTHQFQGPQKKFPVMTGFDLLSKTAHAYEARKSDLQGSWKEQACMAEREAARSEPAPE